MPNRLGSETSPYLQQHADNPVDWWPWCAEALALAHKLDRPILLSIGYSACHWCHVMAHESFEDETVAALMNRLFINIKVDREERPDLDQIYQSAHQILARRSGGWPLTMFLTPDGTPFFGGTYFPSTSRYRLPGFGDVLQRIAEAFATKRQAIVDQNAALRAALGRAARAGGGGHHSDFGPQPPSALRQMLGTGFDARFGGFGMAPKFPHPTDLEFLLRRYRSTGDGEARDMALLTLQRMAEGGLYDQLGGGFYRYSTDERWLIPHFEKMLYDNGPLLGLYVDACQLDGNPLFGRVVEDTAAWVMREMQAPEGGYYSALDADAEGEEGRFYVWDRDELSASLAPHVYAVVERHYGLDAPPNFEGRRWHLAVVRPLDVVARELCMAPEDAFANMDEARARLLALRAERVPPGLDHKILTSWNALMIAAMMRAARVFGRPDWHASARRALTFIRSRLWRDGRLLATSAGGPGRLNAYLDDHAFLIEALIESLQTRFESEDLAFAEELADALLERFEDRDAGGFFFTRHDHEALIQRPKPIHDSPTASGNGAAAHVLTRLGHMTGETRYLAAAERCLQAFYGVLGSKPGGCASLIMALEEQLAPPTLIVLRGPAGELEHWQRRLAGLHLPDALQFAISAGEQQLPPVLDKPCSEQACAWVCSGTTCLEPQYSLDELVMLLAR